MNLFSALALSTLVACGGAEADAAASAAGTYKLDTAAFEAAMLAAMPEDQKKDPNAAKMAKAMAEGMDISIELKEDGTAALNSKITMMGQTKETSATGTWKLDGDQLTMTTKDKESDKEETKTATLKDGAFSVTEEENGMKMTMTFKKQ